MNFAAISYKIFIGILVFSFVSGLFGVITFPEDLIYLFFVMIFISITMLIHESLLTFLTVKKVFLTRLVVISITVTLVLILFDYTIPGFSIAEFTLDPKRIEFITIESYTFPKYATIALLGFATGFFSAFVIWLEKSGKQA